MKPGPVTGNMTNLTYTLETNGTASGTTPSFPESPCVGTSSLSTCAWLHPVGPDGRTMHGGWQDGSANGSECHIGGMKKELVHPEDLEIRMHRSTTRKELSTSSSHCRGLQAHLKFMVQESQRGGS